MEPQFNVVFTGQLKPGVEREAFIKSFCQRFQCDEAKAVEMLDAGKAVKMKSAVPREVAEKFKTALESLGMSIRLDPVAAQSGPAAPPPRQSAPAPEPAAANPYQAPKAALSEARVDGEMTGPVTVPFGHGSHWIGTAWSDHFKPNALAWIGAFFLFAVLSLIIQLIPLVGMIVSTLLSPVLTAGLMLGAKAQDDGEDFTVGHLFSGFKQSTGQLILVGLLYLLGMVAVIIIVSVVMGGSFAMLGGLEAGDPAAAQAVAQNPMAMLLPMLVMMLLFIPLLMAYWFAPALVAIDGISALSAMKLSFSGCIKNVLPFTLYGIVMLLLSIVAAIPLFLGYFILLPVMMASMYTAYRDIYYPDA